MRALLLLMVAVAGAPALAQSRSEEEAGDVSEVDKDALGPLRERIRPVSGSLFLKKNRLEVSPSLTFSFRDSFYSKYVLGASVTYHFSESTAVGVRLGYSIPAISGAARVCDTNQGVTTCRGPTDGEFNGKVPGNVTLLGGLDLQWAPIYGKISVSSEKFLHFDMYGLVGAAAVQYVAPTGSTFTVGGSFGLGMRFFINRWLTVRTELRDLLYQETTAGAASFRNQFLLELGFSMFFPNNFEEG